MGVAFPQYRDELIELLEKDQSEISHHYQKLQALNSKAAKNKLNSQFKMHCHARAKRMMDILHEIKEPSITNIGVEGSEAISVLALHSYLDEMKEVLSAYEFAYEHDPNNVYKESIPSLTDRIMIFEERAQLYGSNWSLDKDGKYFLIRVKDFEHMNERRAKFGLGPRMKPTIYAIGEEKYPLGKGKAKASDQKDLTDEEYVEFTRGHIR